jgi:hypothetical protein
MTLLLHIGYHKTATSWMQQYLFTPRHGFRQIASHAEVFAHVVQPHGLRFDPRGLAGLIAARADGPGVPVISSEILSGHPFQGGHESDVYAERLAMIAPGARILISIRAQLRIIPSVYAQYVLRGGTMTPAQFLQGTSEPGYFGFTPEHFEYDRLVGRYQALFGPANVFVMTQESLQQDMAAAAAAVARFAGAEDFTELVPEARHVHAASYPEYALPILRRINHVQQSTLNPNPIISVGQTPKGLYRIAGYALRRPPFSTLLAGRKPVSDLVKARFSGHFDQSNRRLSQIACHPLDLSGYGPD